MTYKILFIYINVVHLLICIINSLIHVSAPLDHIQVALSNYELKCIKINTEYKRIDK
jgi:hypothetical protein